LINLQDLVVAEWKAHRETPHLKEAVLSKVHQKVTLEVEVSEAVAEDLTIQEAK
jgi:hypothetical protein